jgi:hypothetical protein
MKKYSIHIALLIFALLAVLPIMTVSNAEAALGDFLFKWGAGYNFWWPYDVAVDGLGNVYVADSLNHRIQVFDNTGTFIRKWGSPGYGDGQIYYPYGIAADGLGNVYVADRRIQGFDSTGTFIRKLGGSYGSGDGEFRSPFGVAVDGLGSVYVPDFFNHRIQVFDSTGTFIRKWGSQGSGDGQFKYPMDIAVDGPGNVYVVDFSNNRIQVFDSEGMFITTWGSYGSGDGEFRSPFGIAVDGPGNVYVADTLNYRIQVFDSTGTFLGKWGSPGNGDGQFRYPRGIAVDGAGNVYVADTSNNRIQVFAGLNTTPGANAGPDQTVECAGPGGSSVTLNGAGSSDPDGDALTYTWTGPFGTETGVSPAVTIPLGTHTVTLTVDDGNGETATDDVVITVEDTTPPSSIATLFGDEGNNDWFKSAVDVKIDAMDACTGVKAIYYVLDADPQVESFANPTWVPTITEDGQHTLTYWSEDNAGNYRQVTVPVKKEAAPPVTTPTLPEPPPDTGGNYTSCVNVTLQTTSVSGEEVTEYSLDGGITWDVYTGQFTICDEGTTNVQYRSTSSAGNVEDPKTIEINIDTTPPVTTATLTGDMGTNGWYVTAVAVALEATDATSGVAEIHYVLDGVEQVVSTDTATFTVSLDGTHTVTYWAKDVAGNEEAVKEVPPFNIDLTLPVITISGVAEGEKYPACTPPTPSYTADDATSGLATHSATLDGGNANGVGTYTYTVTATDNAGNTATETVTYKVVYSFGGFQTPVTLNKPFKLGSTIPVKLVLTDGCGAFASNATATLSLIQLSGAEPLGEPIDGTTNVPDSGNVFRYVLADNHYIYNLSTDGLSVGEWRATVTLDDGEQYTVDIGIK